MTFAVLLAAGQARETWLSTLPPGTVAEVSAETGEWNGIPGAVATGWGWLTADGELLSSDEARKLANDAGVAPR